jgi:hypothetical protein
LFKRILKWNLKSIHEKQVLSSPSTINFPVLAKATMRLDLFITRGDSFKVCGTNEGRPDSLIKIFEENKYKKQHFNWFLMEDFLDLYLFDLPHRHLKSA